MGFAPRMEPPSLHAQLPPKHAPAPTVSAPRTEPPLLHAQQHSPKHAPAPMVSAPRMEPPLLHAQLPSHKHAPVLMASAPRMVQPLHHAQLLPKKKLIKCVLAKPAHQLSAPNKALTGRVPHVKVSEVTELTLISEANHAIKK